MVPFILDCSVAMSWCFEDEGSRQSDKILSLLTQNNSIYKAYVPSLWHLEITNILYIAEKKKRLTSAESLQFLDLLGNLAIETDIRNYSKKDILTLSRAYDLSAYDANYLLLSIKTSFPIATFDKKLLLAAKKANLSIFDFEN